MTPFTAPLRFAPATHARPVRATRLVVVSVPTHEVRESTFHEFPRLFARGDVLVVNDAATLPASVTGHTRAGDAIELRLLALPDTRGECDAVLFGAGDWRTQTEHRPPPPALAVGDVILVAGMEATLTKLVSARRVRLRFERAHTEAVAAIYSTGRPVQYAHMNGALPLWDVQNVYASEPWAAEMPSAGRPLDFETIDTLRKRGVLVVGLTHAAGLSSIGDAGLDTSLPWVERYRIPEATAEIVTQAKARGKRVIAVGTSVVRALESAAADGRLRAGEATTTLRIDASHSLRVASGLLTGMHDGATSHADLVSAFVPIALLSQASRFAVERGFLGHELGDSCLILRA